MWLNVLFVIIEKHYISTKLIIKNNHNNHNTNMNKNIKKITPNIYI